MPTSFWSIYHKPTLGLLAGSLAIIYSIPAFFYCLTLTGGESFKALLYLYLFLAGVITIIIDNLLINNLNNLLTVSIIEALLFALSFVVITTTFKHDGRKAIINILNIKNSYTIIIEDSSGLSINKFYREGLFDKQINITDNTGIIHLNGKSLLGYIVEFQGLGISQIVHNGCKPEYNYNWEFIYDGNKYNYSDKEIDSLVQARLWPGAILHNPNFQGF